MGKKVKNLIAKLLLPFLPVYYCEKSDYQFFYKACKLNKTIYPIDFKKKESWGVMGKKEKKEYHHKLRVAGAMALYGLGSETAEQLSKDVEELLKQERVKMGKALRKELIEYLLPAPDDIKEKDYYKGFVKEVVNGVIDNYLKESWGEECLTYLVF